MADEQASEHKTVRISSTNHRITIVGEDRHDVDVEGAADYTVEGDSLTLGDVAGKLTVRVPLGSDVVIGSDSGRVDVRGPVGHLAVVTGSGRVDVEQAQSADVRTTSGRLRINRCEGMCRVRSESGRVRVDRCRGADVAADSARITLGHVDGPVRAHCVSGRIDIELDGAHDVDAETVSGHVTVSLPDGTHSYRSDEPGKVMALPEGCDCIVRARSVSGRVDVSTR